MHIKSKGRAEEIQILCQGHGKGKGRRVSTLSSPYCCCALRNGSSPCPRMKEDVAGVCGVESHRLPGCHEEMVLMTLFLPAASTSSWEMKDSFAPWCKSDALRAKFSEDAHRITGWFWVGRLLKNHGQRHLPLVHIVQSLIQPGLDGSFVLKPKPPH